MVFTGSVKHVKKEGKEGEVLTKTRQNNGEHMKKDLYQKTDVLHKKQSIR